MNNTYAHDFILVEKPKRYAVRTLWYRDGTGITAKQRKEMIREIITALRITYDRLAILPLFSDPRHVHTLEDKRLLDAMGRALYVLRTKWYMLTLHDLAYLSMMSVDYGEAKGVYDTMGLLSVMNTHQAAVSADKRRDSKNREFWKGLGAYVWNKMAVIKCPPDVSEDELKNLLALIDPAGPNMTPVMSTQRAILSKIPPVCLRGSADDFWVSLRDAYYPRPEKPETEEEIDSDEILS